MKKTIMLTVMLMAVCAAKAQLKVDSLGNVHTFAEVTHDGPLMISTPRETCVSINRTPGDSLLRNYNINSTVYQSSFSLPNRSTYTYNIYARTIGNNNGNIGYCVGVFSSASGGGNKKSAIHGQISGYGIGVYGGTASLPPSVGQKTYAGYFGGATHVQGDLTVSGTINGTVLSNSASPSSSTLSITELGTNDRSIIPTMLQNLTSYAYFLNPLQNTSSTDENPSEVTKDIDDEALDEVKKAEYPESNAMERQIYDKQHFGLDADQLEEVFPDLVYENEDGTKSINYVEMVPILVQAINELKSELDEIKGTGNATKKTATRGTVRIDRMNENVTLLSLGQNKPNPFDATTSIEVSIPEDVQKAFIYVYDLQGKKIDQVDITARGKQTIQLDAATFSDGMYLYSLIADGKVVETRRMIVEK